MSIYDTIKAQEANFPLPQPRATMFVGTFDANAGVFKYAVPIYTEITWTIPELGQGGSTKPEREVITGGNVIAINIFDLTLQFRVTGQQGDFALSVPEQPPIYAAPGQDFVEVDVGAANSLQFTLTCNGHNFVPKLPLKITRQIV